MLIVQKQQKNLRASSCEREAACHLCIYRLLVLFLSYLVDFIL